MIVFLVKFKNFERILENFLSFQFFLDINLGVVEYMEESIGFKKTYQPFPTELRNEDFECSFLDFA